MRPSLSDLAKQKFDVIVIGGGINGAGIAREAALAGYRTLLVERNDFGAGTTSRSTRLIHGGLRYLEHGEFGLVYESLGERQSLLREAAHLVRPLRLLVPVYRDDHRPPWKVRAGLVMYDLFSFRKSMPRHRGMPASALDAYEPGLSRDGLRAAFTFYDAQVEFPERLVAESVREMTDAGGVAMNHTACEHLISPGGVLRALVLRDDLTGEKAEVETSVAINAAGPWVDEVIAGTDAERHDRLIGGTKGSHLVAEWPDGPRHAVFATAKEDGRPFFILPWYRYTLVGTTDLRYDGDPSTAQCTPNELRYLLDEASRLFPRSPLRAERVLYTYSGIRPLPYTERGDESAITRSHFIIDHVKRGGPKGLLSIVGGKLTTYRSLSRLALPAIAKHLPPSGVHVATPTVGAEPRLRPARPAAEAQGAPGVGAEPRLRPARPAAETQGAPSVGAEPRLRPAIEPGDPLAIYGPRRHEVQALIDADPALAEPICEHNPEVLAQVAYAVEHEHAVTLADVLLRRLPVGWSKCHALDGAERAARIIAPRLGWSDGQIVREVASYERELRATLVPVDALTATSS